MPLKKTLSLLRFSGKKGGSSSDSDTGTSLSGGRRNGAANPVLSNIEESELEATVEVLHEDNPSSCPPIYDEGGVQCSAADKSNGSVREENSTNNKPFQVDSNDDSPSTPKSPPSEHSSDALRVKLASSRDLETATPPSRLRPSSDQDLPSTSSPSFFPDTTVSVPPMSPPKPLRALPPTPLTNSTNSRARSDFIPLTSSPKACQTLRLLREAIINGNIAAITHLIVHGTDVTSLPTLYLAAWHGHFDICQLLLSHNAPLEHKLDGDVSPLIAACYRGHIRIVKLLLSRGADITESSVAYGNCLSASCQSGNADVVKLFLRKERLVVHSLNAVWRDNGGPLHLACKDGHLEVAELLLAAGARIDLPAEPDKETPLCFACIKPSANLDLVSFLLDNHADIDGADCQSVSPLGYACRANNLPLVELLLKRGANVDDHLYGRDLPLYIACQERNLGLVKLLIEHGAHPNIKCNDKRPLEVACETDQRDMIMLLVQHGAILSPGSMVHLPVPGPTVKSGGGAPLTSLKNTSTLIRSTRPPAGYISQPQQTTWTTFLDPLEGALHVGNAVATERLLEEGARTDPLELTSMLYAAASKGHLDLCEVLLARGASLSQGRPSPLIVSSLHGHLPVVQLLLKHGAPVTTVSTDHGNCINAACTSGNIELVRLLLAEPNLDVNLCPLTIGMPPLCFACSLPESEDNLSLVSLFLDKGADVNIRGIKASPLGIACTKSNLPLVRLLVKHGAKILEESTVSPRDLPLQIACRKGNVALVQLLFDLGANPNAIYPGAQPLRLACAQGRDDIVQRFLEKDARVDDALLSEYGPVLLRAFQASTHRVDTVDGQPALVIATTTMQRPANGPSFDMNLLRKAISADDLASVQRLLSLATDITSEPLLCLAAWSGNLLICEVLLKHHAPLECKDDNDTTPLLAASVKGYTPIAKLLLDHGANAEYSCAAHGSCAEAACRTGNSELVALFLERKKINVNGLLGKYGSPLHAACLEGHHALARLFIEHGADVNLPGPEKKQPILFACAASEPNLDIVTFLLNKGADVQASFSPSSPLNKACFSGNIPLVELLLSRGASVHDRSRSQELPLHIAIEQGNLDLVKLLLQNGADPNEANGGNMALDITCRGDIAFPNLDILRCLLENGAKIHPHSTAHTPVFERAFRTGATGLVSLFLKRGAFSLAFLKDSCTKGDVNMTRVFLENADPAELPKTLVTDLLLTIACPQGHLSLVELLVRHGADCNAERSGLTPLESACRNGSYDLVKCLLKAGANLSPRSTCHIPIFERALRDHDQPLVDLFIRMKAISNSLLRYAVKEKDVVLATEILKRGANISQSVATELLLHLCSSPSLPALNVSLMLFKQLISQGADPNTNGILHTACVNGQTQLVDLLLTCGVQCNALHLGNTALYVASFAGHVKIVELLLSKGALVDHGTSTPLHATCVTGNGTIAAMLLASDAKIKAQDIRTACENGSVDVLDRLLKISPGLVENDLLLIACQRGYFGVVQCLVRNGQAIEKALHAACECANVEIVRSLLEEPTVLPIMKSAFETPLRAACALRGHQSQATEIVQLLLRNGADPNASLNSQALPLTIASENGHVEVVKDLLVRGAHVDAEDGAAFLAACRGGHLSVLKTLVSYGTLPTSKLAIRQAVANGHAHVIEWLLDNGEDVECSDPAFGTLLHLACTHGHLEASRSLVKRGAVAENMHEEVGTPLMCASRNANITLVLYLIDGCAADINARSPRHETAVEAAASYGQTLIVELLLSRGAEVGNSLKIALEKRHEKVAKLVLAQRPTPFA
ncbi:ankyrin repeat-containing domain protein [Flagelloscypha sp. PMI_526]|nr:ankyrin repeat-containing domain protein [Flagelloscypha sp. PMI_526]